MNSITISEQDKVLVVDSRLIAQELGIDHKSFLKTIKRYKSLLERHFERARFEVSDVQMPNGAIRQDISHYWLAEDQSTALMTLSKNTEQVVECKFKLVGAFSEAKKKLQQPIASKPQQQIEDLTEPQLKSIVSFATVNKDCGGKLDPSECLKGIDPAFWHIPVAVCVYLLKRSNLNWLENDRLMLFAGFDFEHKDLLGKSLIEKKKYDMCIEECKQALAQPKLLLPYQEYVANLAPALTRGEATDSKPKPLGFGKPKK